MEQILPEKAEGERLAAVVVNHHGPGLLARCLRALALQGLAGGQVLVVDNASPPREVRAAITSFPGVRVLRNTKNLGFAAGANRGLRLALAEGAGRIFLLNNDVFPEPGCLAALAAFLDATPGAGACQPLLVYDHRPGTVQSAGCGAGLTGRCWDMDQGKPVQALGNHPRDVLGVSGAAVLFRAKALDRAGLFDQSFGMYFEDVDLSLRLRGQGYALYCLPGALARHVGRGSARPLPVWRRIFLCEKNALLMAGGRYPPLSALAALALGPLTSLGGFTARLASGSPREALAYPAGALAGAFLALPRFARALSGDRRPPYAARLSRRVVFPAAGRPS